MGRTRDPFGMAVERLRSDLREGRLIPGAPLLATELAQALKISVTPVREALVHLAGEGLVEELRGRGFTVPRYSDSDVESAYRVHGAYISIALEAVDAAPVEPGNAVTFASPRERAEALWRAVVVQADSAFFARAYTQLNNQIAILRLIEPEVLDGLEQEISSLEAAMYSGAVQDRRLQTANYHARRIEASRLLSRVLRTRFGGSRI